MVFTACFSVGGSAVLLAEWKGSITTSVDNLTKQSSKLEAALEKLADKFEIFIQAPKQHVCIKEGLLGEIGVGLSMHKERFVRLENRIHDLESK
jgi:hypothetical protein